MGDRYLAGKTHNSATLEVDLDEVNTHLKVPQKDQSYKYNNNRRNNKGKVLKRSPSPYARDNKGKQNQNPAYKGKDFNENFQASKSKEPTQSTSKDKA